MAERLALVQGEKLQIPNFVASSAGTRAVIGHAIHYEAGLVLASLGGDGSDFAARQLTPKIAAAADLILTMSRSHRDRVLELAPRRLRRTFTLSEAARLASDRAVNSLEDLAERRPLLLTNESPDVLDPIGHGREVFESIGSQIADLLVPVMELCSRDARS